MTKGMDQVISILNRLIETCKDGEKGYREAADAISNAFHRTLFQEYARRRGQLASELQSMVKTLGGDPDWKGTFSGTLHRSWMNLHASVAGRNDDWIIAACERGEKAALEHYENALSHDLTPEILTLLKTQHDEIKATFSRVSVMESHH